MRSAIDIGSNSIRLALPDGTVLSEITKLADGIEKSGVLSASGVERSLVVLKEFVRAAAGTEIIAFATEAVRRASDGKDFCRKVKAQTGIDIRILSGEDEARLALFGAKKPIGPATVCDLGGGSMEVISASDGINPEYILSLPLGVVVLKNKYKGDFRAAIDEAPELVEPYAKAPVYPMTAIGGSVCAIAAALMNLSVYDKNKINGYTVTTAALDDALPMFMSKDFAVFRPVCAKRADTIPYGAIILRALMQRLGQTAMNVSDSGNLDAVMSNQMLLHTTEI